MMQDKPRARRLFRSRVYFKVTIARFGDAVADAGILDGAGDARPGVAAEGVAHREQGFAQGRAFAEHLPGGDHAARGHGVVIAELPAVEAPLFAQLVDEAFHSEIRLVDPEPPERARRKVIREYRLHMHVHGGDVVGAGGMGAGTGDDRAARRGVRAGIRDDTDLGGLQDSLFVAADDVMELHAVALGVHTDRFGPGEPDLDRTPKQIRGERGMGLAGEVLLAAECAAGVGQRNRDLGRGDMEQGSYVGLVVPDTLRLDIEAYPARFGNGQRRFGLDEGVLDRLGPIRGLGGEGAAGQCLVHGLTAPDGLVEQDIAVFVDMDGRGFRLLHVEERRQNLIIDLDAGRRSTGFGLGFRDHAGQRVADVTGDFANLDIDGPVLGVKAEHTLAGDVVGGQDADDAGHVRRFIRMDGKHAGPGMLAEDDGSVRHAGRVNVVDEGAGSDSPFVAAILGPARSEARVVVGFGNVPFR